MYNLEDLALRWLVIVMRIWCQPSTANLSQGYCFRTAHMYFWWEYGFNYLMSQNIQWEFFFPLWTNPRNHLLCCTDWSDKKAFIPGRETIGVRYMVEEICSSCFWNTQCFILFQKNMWISLLDIRCISKSELWSRLII